MSGSEFILGQDDIDYMLQCIQGVQDPDFLREKFAQFVEAATADFIGKRYNPFAENVESLLDNFKSFIYTKYWPEKAVPTLCIALGDNDFKALMSKAGISIKNSYLTETRLSGNIVKHDAAHMVDATMAHHICWDMKGWVEGFCNLINSLYQTGYTNVSIVEKKNSKNKISLTVKVRSQKELSDMSFEYRITEKRDAKGAFKNMPDCNIPLFEQDDTKYVKVRVFLKEEKKYVDSKVYGPIDWKRLKNIKEDHIKQDNTKKESTKQENSKQDENRTAESEDIQKVIAASQRICNKIILMKYGTEGIRPDYISTLCTKENIAGVKNEYLHLADLVKAYSKSLVQNAYDKDVRILLSGDVCSGRATQLLHTYATSFKREDCVVFYLSPSLMGHLKPIEYIYNAYFKEIPSFGNLSPEDAFFSFKAKIKPNKRILLLVDDYDKIDPAVKNETDCIFKYESRLIADVDLVIKVRYKDGSWPHNFTEAFSKGVSEKGIRKVFREKNISADQIQLPASCLQSPWLLKILVDELSGDAGKISNAGQLIRKSISSRVDAAARNGNVNMDMLRFSVFALLPHITFAGITDKTQLINALPQLIDEAIDSGSVPEAFEMMDYLESLNHSRSKIYQEFFRFPLIQTMGFLREVKQTDSTKISLEWKDATTENFFLAVELLNLFSTDSMEKALEFIKQITNSMLSAEHFELREETDSSVFVSFDCARYFIDLIGDDELGKLQNLYPKQFAYLYSGLAVIYELFGNDRGKYDSALKAVRLLRPVFEADKEDQINVGSLLSKMSYFIVKSNGSDFTGYYEAVETARECFSEVMEVFENQTEESNIAEKLELSRLYGNMGAYYLRQKEYDLARQWHEKSLAEKTDCLKASKESEQIEIEEAIRRSLVSLATDCYYLGLYEESVAYHDKAIETGERFQLRNRYESYSRKVGNYIAMYNRDDNWSIDKAEELLKLLLEDVSIMGEYINKNEVANIYEKVISILSGIAGILKTNQDIGSVKTLGLQMESIYNQILWKNTNRVEVFFKENADG